MRGATKGARECRRYLCIAMLRSPFRGLSMGLPYSVHSYQRAAANRKQVSPLNTMFVRHLGSAAALSPGTRLTKPSGSTLLRGPYLPCCSRVSTGAANRSRVRQCSSAANPLTAAGVYCCSLDEEGTGVNPGPLVPPGSVVAAPRIRRDSSGTQAAGDGPSRGDHRVPHPSLAAPSRLPCSSLAAWRLPSLRRRGSLAAPLPLPQSLAPIGAVAAAPPRLEQNCPTLRHGFRRAHCRAASRGGRPTMRSQKAAVARKAATHMPRRAASRAAARRRTAPSNTSAR